MATNAKAGVVPQLASARVATAVWKVSSSIVISGRIFDSKQKHTVQSTGIWERIRRALTVDPNRSNGVPLNAQYRNPPPGANPPEAYDDPVTVPAGDIADNAYYKRDIRRNYPRLSVVKQADIVGLLSVGSKAYPKDSVLQIGDLGAKQLVQVKQEGEEKGLAALFKKNKESTMSILGRDGLPPFPSGMNRVSSNGEKKYVMDADRAEGFPEEYVEKVPPRARYANAPLGTHAVRLCSNLLQKVHVTDHLAVVIPETMYISLATNNYARSGFCAYYEKQ